MHEILKDCGQQMLCKLPTLCAPFTSSDVNICSSERISFVRDYKTTCYLTYATLGMRGGGALGSVTNVLMRNLWMKVEL
jgi:hypothetical protein